MYKGIRNDGLHLLIGSYDVGGVAVSQRIFVPRKSVNYFCLLKKKQGKQKQTWRAETDSNMTVIGQMQTLIPKGKT